MQLHPAYGKSGTWTHAVCTRGVEIAASKNRINSLKDWLRGLVWDGEHRAETWLVRAGGVKDTLYTRQVSKMWLISAVARALTPGCKVDYVLVVEGEQGFKKSHMFHALGKEWFLGVLGDLREQKAVAEQLRAKWIVEDAEFAAFGGCSAAMSKRFITLTEDRYRAAYGRRAGDYPRMCVFCATTNKLRYLRDPTGDRRYWPVTMTHEADLEWLEANREQLFAEAVVRFNAGEQWWSDDEAFRYEAEYEQDMRFVKDPWEARVVATIRSSPEASVDELLQAVGLPVDRRSQRDLDRIHDILERHGRRNRH
jgi:putative DNA primase/helicase